MTTPEFGFGALRFTWANTYLAGYKEFTLGEDGLVGRELAGIELGSPIRGYMRYKSTLATDWQVRDFVTSLTLRYLSAIDGYLHGERHGPRTCAAIRRGTSTSWTRGCTRTCRWRGRRRSGISRCSWRWASTTSSTRIRRRAARAT